MSRVQVIDRSTPVDQAAPTAPPSDDSHGRPTDGPPALRRIGAALTAVGLGIAVVVAFALGVPGTGDGGPQGTEPPPELTRVVGPTTIRTGGPVELSAQSMSYAPGHRSGWHTHPGLHLVSILSGTLTVLEADCRPQTFGPGQFYVGGERLHDARNETDAPLDMAVTYITRPGQSMQHFRIDGAAPADCPIQ